MAVGSTAITPGSADLAPQARQFYEQEALRGGWIIRQLDRHIGSQI